MLARLSIALFFAAAVTMAPAGFSARAESKQAPMQDNRQTSANKEQVSEVLSDLHMTNRMEIEMGRLAKEKGASQAVRQFGDKLMKDHQQADKQTMEVAQAQGVKLEEKDSAEKIQEHTEELEGLKGAEFDRKFTQMMVDDHKKKIEKLQKAQRDLTGTPVGKLIAQVIPVLQEHERRANELLAKAQKSS